MSEPWERFSGTVREGKLRMDQRIRLDRTVAQWEGKRVEVALRIAPVKRTLDQNSYIHPLCRLIAEHTGETELYTRRLATLSALGIEAGTTKETILGQEFVSVRGTSELRKEEASAVIEWLLDKCSFLGLAAPKAEQYVSVA